MVLGHHIILTAYGFWLPNDPRGSWSDFVGAWELAKFGPATRTTERRSLAASVHDRGLRAAAKRALKYPPVHFGGLQARAIVRGFATFATRSALTIWACSILSDHLHLVVSRHRMKAEQIMNQLKGAATRQLQDEGIHPLASFAEPSGRPPKAFARGGWKVFLNDGGDIQRAIQYVQNNPVKEGKRPQRWNFVQAFDSTSIDALPSRGSGRG